MRRQSTLNPIIGLLWVGAFFAGFMALGLHALYLDRQFDQSTYRSQGTVEHEWWTHGSKGGTHYHVRYHFSDDQGRLWTIADADVSPGTYRSIRTGSLVPVKYLGDNPSRSRIDWPNEALYHWHQDKILFYISLGLGVLLLFLLTSRRG